MNNFSHILQKLMKEQGLTESELARRTKIGQPVIHRIASGETEDPKVGTMSAIANYFSISINQLMGDEPLPKNRRVGLHQKSTFGWNKAPLLSWEAAINWPKNKNTFEEVEYILTDANVSAEVYALRVKDTTMRPLFPEEMVLIIDPALKPLDRDYAIIYLKSTQQVLFRQILFDGNNIYGKPLNSDFKIIPLEEKETLFLGVVVQSKGDYK